MLWGRGLEKIKRNKTKNLYVLKISFLEWFNFKACTFIFRSINNSVENIVLNSYFFQQINHLKLTTDNGNLDWEDHPLPQFWPNWLLTLQVLQWCLYEGYKRKFCGTGLQLPRPPSILAKNVFCLTKNYDQNWTAIS